MAYIRQGECNRCGECCGAPRSTDGGSNNAWPVDLASATRSWSQESIEFALPIFKWLEHPRIANKTSGRLRIGDVNSPYVFSTQYGLVKSDAVPECPALLGKQTDEVRPCGLVGTVAEEVYTKICQYFPPDRFLTQASKEDWEDNCPSCSYTWLEVAD